MFEPVCQSGESESNDSHADTDSDSDTDGDMYRGLAHQPVQLSGASVGLAFRHGCAQSCPRPLARPVWRCEDGTSQYRIFSR